VKPDNLEFGAHLTKHGDGAKDVAFTVDDAESIYNAAVKNGAKSIREPFKKDGLVSASVQTYGDTIHTFIQRSEYTGHFLPGYIAVTKIDPLLKNLKPVGLDFIDHIVGNQGWNEMDSVVDWYKEKLGFIRFWSVDDKQIHTDYSALKSTVVCDVDENCKMPINEPAKGKKVSQIEEYVEFYGGSGVQHIALNTDDILTSVDALCERGVEFLPIPDSYYDNLEKRLSHAPIKVKEDLATIKKFKILVDFDDQGYLLQIFTKPVQDRPTVFYEIIQRRNNRGFGIGNFKALFQAIEDEQARRGTLRDSEK